jgi:hypothetical protein
MFGTTLRQQKKGASPEWTRTDNEEKLAAPSGAPMGR